MTRSSGRTSTSKYASSNRGAESEPEDFPHVEKVSRKKGLCGSKPVVKMAEPVVQVGLSGEDVSGVTLSSLSEKVVLMEEQMRTAMSSIAADKLVGPEEGAVGGKTESKQASVKSSRQSSRGGRKRRRTSVHRRSSDRRRGHRRRQRSSSREDSSSESDESSLDRSSSSSRSRSRGRRHQRRHRSTRRHRRHRRGSPKPLGKYDHGNFLSEGQTVQKG